MSGCGCEVDTKLAEHSKSYARVLWIVVALNAAMFVVGLFITVSGGSVSVRADVLDFLSDAFATGIGLVLINRPTKTRATVSLGQGLVLGGLGVYALAAGISRALGGVPPEAFGMGMYGVLALFVNVGAAALLFRFREGDANVRAVWLYSRNDAIGNVAVIFAAIAVVATSSRWPDVIVGVALAALFLHSAYEIVRDAKRELGRAVA